MAGPYARDTNAPELVAGVTLNAAGSTTGTAVRVDHPGAVEVEMVTPTVTSTTNSATLLVRIEAADDSGFATNKVTVAEFPVKSGTDASQSAKTFRVRSYIMKRYARIVVTIGGTAPVYTGLSVKVHQAQSRANIKTDTA
jgi:hypothetical protein